MASLSPAEYALIFIVLFQLLIVAALWRAMKRARHWKEQILHAVAVLQSNSHIDQVESRKESAQQIAGEVQELTDSVNREFAALREAQRKLEQQISFRDLDGLDADIPRLEELPAPKDLYQTYVDFLQTIDHATKGSRTYLDFHRQRTARTLSAAPPPVTGRALELGAYGYMAAGLGCVAGYTDVRCAYLGTSGQHISRPVFSKGKEIFRCEYDLFDAERDAFPYPDETFELVLACEIIEHLTRDPMYMLLECARVLSEGGALIVSTPNVVSLTSVARSLTAAANPQIHSLYSFPSVEAEPPHVREYAPRELRDAVLAAGFTVEYLFTERIDGCAMDSWVADLLRHFRLPETLRGEQIYCVARKRRGLPTTRYPVFLYDHPPDV